MKTNKPLEDPEVHEGPFSRDKTAHPRRGHPATRDSSMPRSNYPGRESQDNVRKWVVPSHLESSSLPHPRQKPQSDPAVTFCGFWGAASSLAVSETISGLKKVSQNNSFCCRLAWLQLHPCATVQTQGFPLGLWEYFAEWDWWVVRKSTQILWFLLNRLFSLTALKYCLQ